MANTAYPSVVVAAYRQEISVARNLLDRMVNICERRKGIKADMLAQLAAAVAAITALP